MPVKELFAPHLNRNVKMGRRHPVALGPRLEQLASVKILPISYLYQYCYMLFALKQHITIIWLSTSLKLKPEPNLCLL
jgi:hypothetical protein